MPNPDVPTDPAHLLFEAALYYAQAIYGQGAVKVTLTLTTGQKVGLPIVHCARLSADEVRDAVTDPDGRQCRADILLTLREVGHRLTGTRLMDELEARGRIHGVSTTKGHLALLVRERLLTKDSTARPPGYGLPEWSRPTV